MSQPTSAKKPSQTPAFVTESQHDRWVKYGSNVALVIVITIVLGLIVTALAQSKTFRAHIDTTSEGSNTLKPQTVSIIEGLDQKVRVVGLYPKAKTKWDQDYYTKVAAVLDNYQRTGHNVSAEMIDPLSESGKVDQLIADVSKRGGGGEKRYVDFLDDFEKSTLPQVDKFANSQYESLNAAIEGIPKAPDGNIMVSQDLAETIQLARISVQSFPDALQQLEQEIKKDRTAKIPDYRGAVDSIRSDVRSLSDLLKATNEQFDTIKNGANTPPSIKSYIDQNQKQFVDTKKTCDDLIDKIKGLGELKELESLRQNLKTKSIVVLTDSDMQVIGHEALWRLPENKDPTRPPDAEDAVQKLRFVGEQSINAAILSLTEKTKPTVAFIRVGGEPLAEMGGQFSVVAERLKQNGFTVVEHDASGMAAAQAQMANRPPPPDATPEQLKDAVWVVFNRFGSTVPMGGGEMMGQGGGSMPNPLGPQLAEHLKSGGSAMALFFFQNRAAPPDDLSSALKDWGVDVKTDAACVHERLQRQPGRPTSDMVERARRVPYIFVLNEFGAHPVVNNLNSLDCFLAVAFPVQTRAVSGFKATPIIPIPQSPRSWGERNWESVFGDAPLNYHDKPSKELEKQVADAQADVAQSLKAVQDVQSNRQALDDARGKSDAAATADAAKKIVAIVADIKQRGQRLKDSASELAFDGHPDIQKPAQAVDPAVTAIETADTTVQQSLADMNTAAAANDFAKTSVAAVKIADQAKQAAQSVQDAAQKLTDALTAKTKLGNDIVNDPASPMYCGAVVEKDGGGRLVVLGNAASSFNQLVSFTDPNLEDQEMSVLRFPANGELFTNSIYWLAKKDRMLALSPATVQVSRIRDINPFALNTIRVVVLIAGLPLLVLAGGFMVFLRRQG